MAAQFQIFFINQQGGGFANNKSVVEGTTLGQLFESEVGGNPRNYQIRVNRDIQPMDYRLQAGDRVTVSPTKVEGAISY